MPPLHTLTRPQRESLNERVLDLFVEFSASSFHFTLYAYEVEIARELLSSIFVYPHDVYVKMSRQSGKTETLTLVIRCLIVFLEALLGHPLLCGIASPKGEQAKTDLDRVKKSVPILRANFQVEDREFNELTVRAYRFGRLVAEIYRFSLAPTTTNESKTLNLLVIEESHKCDHQRRADQLDPMLSSTNGPTWHFGVGCPVVSDYKRGCDGDYPDAVAIWIDVDRVIADRRAMYEKTGDPAHLGYQHLFERLLRKYGRQNPEIRRNYYLEDTVEEGNFVSRERLLACARKADEIVPLDVLFFGVDWARRSDFTWVCVVNDRSDVIDWLKVPHVTYPEQVDIITAWAEEKRTGKRLKEDGSVETFEYTYAERASGLRGDATGGAGDAPNELLQTKGVLPMSEDSFFVFTKQGKNDLYVNYEQALFKDDPKDPLKFSYPADHELTPEFEEQMTALVREYTGDGEYLAVHHPDEPNAKDDAPDATALALLAAARGKVGEIVFL